MHYNWQRFWCPRDGNMNLDGKGFLFDPTSEYARAYNPDVVSFESISQIPCLILLGEPGVGKSTEIEEIKKNTQNTFIQQSFFFDLKKIGSTEEFRKKIFGENLGFRVWLDGNHNLFLFLDSFDDCLFSFYQIQSILPDILHEYKERIESSLYNIRDFKEPANLIIKLREANQKSDPVSFYLKSHLSEAFQHQIDVYQDGKSPSKFFLDTLVEEFNHLLTIPLYQEDIFARVKLSEETQRLLSSKDTIGEKLLKFNRLLLEDTYPHEIPKSQKMLTLFLRVVCRTVEWPPSLEDSLKKLWGEQNVKVYELAPLRRVDVEEAAKKEGLNIDKFIQDICNKGIQPLAIKPITLNFLLTIYKKDKSFPKTQIELYFKGCSELCKEVTKNPVLRQKRERLSSAKRLAVAARIAAITLLGRKRGIWTGEEYNAPAQTVTISQLSGHKEIVDKESSFLVEEADVRETLQTGFFSAREDAGLYGWSHQAYEEFLSALYLTTRMSEEQIINIIFGERGKVYPQLQELAAQIADMNSAICEKIIESDPVVLLRSDIAAKDFKVRENLAKDLLKAFEQDKLLDEPEIRSSYRKLNHPHLVAQLQPYLQKNSGFVVKRAAIDIAEACHVGKLSGSLLNIALDEQERWEIRTNAIYAIKRIGNNKAKKGLLPLLNIRPEKDPHDEIKGRSLLVLWPKFVSIQQVLAVFTECQDSGYIGAYCSFTGSHFIKNLSISDLPIALKWIAQKDSRYGIDFSVFGEVKEALMHRAFENLRQPVILEIFANMAFSALKKHQPIIEKSHASLNWSAFPKERRMVIKALVQKYKSKKEISQYLSDCQDHIINAEDVPWMIGCLKRSNHRKHRRLWSALIGNFFKWNATADQISMIIEASKKNVELYNEIKSWVEPIKINSKKAKKLREDYQKREVWIKRRQEKKTVSPTPKEKVLSLVDAFENGDLDAWWQLNNDMIFDDEGTPQNHKENPDLTVLPVWQLLDDGDKDRIIKCAEHYVATKKSAPDEWLGKDVFYYPDMSGYKALFLLYQLLPAKLEDLPTDVWQTWDPIILAYPYVDSEADEKKSQSHAFLLQQAYKHAPNEVIKSLLKTIDKENRSSSSYIFIIRRVQSFWDEKIEKSLLKKLQDPELKPRSLSIILSNLLGHGAQKARNYAESLISNTDIHSLTEEERNKYAFIASTLLRYATESSWSLIWFQTKNETELRKKIVEEAFLNGEENVGNQLTEEQSAELFIWLVKQCPYEDEDKIGRKRITHSAGLEDIRDKVLRSLKTKGTTKARQAIQTIKDEFPDIEWLKWTLVVSDNAVLQKSWIPLEPSKIIDMAQNNNMRCVQSEEQLLSIILESLKILEKELQGETPTAKYLWNIEQKAEICRPKEENDLSDYIKHFLQRYLKEREIIATIAREPELRRRVCKKAIPGEQVDLRVDVEIAGENKSSLRKISLIIEVKGCWHTELETAMETQLLKRYLRNNGLRYGLYLVGWFNCGLWDKKDSRKNPAYTLEDAREKFRMQADALSQGEENIKSFVLNVALK